MAQLVPSYDPSVIELAAERLYGKATSVLVGSIITGVVAGAGFGAVPLTSLGSAWPVPSMFGFATMLVGGVVGGLVGYVIGDARAFGYRLQAQAALSQLALERNTAVAAESLATLAARPAPRPAAQPAQEQRAAAPIQPPPQPRPQPQAQPAARPVVTRPAPPPSVTPPPGPPPSVAPPTRV